MKINSDELKKGFALQEDRLITLPRGDSNKEVAELHPAKVLFERDEKFQQAFALYQRMREASQTQTVNQVQENTQVRENN